MLLKFTVIQKAFLTFAPRKGLASSPPKFKALRKDGVYIDMTEMSNIQMEAQTSKKVKGVKATRTSKISKISATMTRARRKFQQQLKKYQNLQTKIDCIEEAAEEVYGKSSQAVWHDLIKETTRLTRLTDFNQYCQSLGLDPSYVAQHIVFAGSGVISKIWRDGAENVLGSMVYDYSEPLVDMLKISGKTISIPKMKLKSVAAGQLMTAVTTQEEVTLVEATEKSTDEETAA